MVRFLKVKFSFQSTPEWIFPNILERRRQKLAERAHGTQRREGSGRSCPGKERQKEGKAIRLNCMSVGRGSRAAHICAGQGGSFWPFWEESLPPGEWRE